MQGLARTLGSGPNGSAAPYSDSLIELLDSACSLIESSSPETIGSTSVYAAASSPEEAHWLAEAAQDLARRHRLLSVVQLIDDRRLHARFFAPPADESEARDR